LDAVGLADAGGDADGTGANVGSRARVCRTSGRSDRELRGLAGAVLLAAEMVGLAGAVCPGAARARAACTPVSVTMVALIAATIHTVTAATAVAPPGLARILLQLRSSRVRRSPAGRGGAVGRPRDVAAVLSSACPSIGSRKPGGSSASGSRRDSTSGRSAPCLRLAHVWQCSRCLAITRPI